MPTASSALTNGECGTSATLAPLPFAERVLCKSVRVTCQRGSANPTQATRLRLWSDSAGHCSNPACTIPLFTEQPLSGDVHFAEAAHIIAASKGGPRSDVTTTDAERGSWSNLLLLCANCHRMVDKAERDYPPQMMIEWKQQRLLVVERALGLATLGSRAQARAEIERFLLQNREIHHRVGPDNDYSVNPEAEEAGTWRRNILDTIIPNHHSVLRTIDANRQLLSGDEKLIVERYRTHVSDLEARHVHRRTDIVSTLYPREMDSVFE